MTTSLFGLKKKKTVTYAEISPKMVNPRDLAENTEEEAEEAVTNEFHLVYFKNGFVYSSQDRFRH